MKDEAIVNVRKKLVALREEAMRGRSAKLLLPTNHPPRSFTVGGGSHTILPSPTDIQTRGGQYEICSDQQYPILPEVTFYSYNPPNVTTVKYFIMVAFCRLALIFQRAHFISQFLKAPSLRKASKVFN